MSIDVSAVARVLGISVAYQMGQIGNAAVLPQRIAVFAQGCTASTYATTKFQPTSAADVGNRIGYGSPAHLIVSQLLPQNGDGVGSIPIDVYPLVDDAAGVAATADITPSGTPTAAAAYNVRISGILGNTFVIPQDTLDVTKTCALIGQSIAAVLGMPMSVSYTYGTLVTLNGSNTGNGTVSAPTITGTPLPGVYKLVCNTVVANGGIWTLTDPNNVVISTSITQTVGSGQATTVNIAGMQFTITDGTTDFAKNDSFQLSLGATKVNLTSKWKGLSANDIVIEVLGPAVSAGVTFAVTQPHGGLVNPSIANALLQVGDVWETLAINPFNVSDTTTLDAFKTWGEGRWVAIVNKPCVVFVGNNAATISDATAVSSQRKADRVNAQLAAPGSVCLPCMIAARQVARIASIANDNPPTDYGSQVVDGIVPGTDAVQWDWSTRDAAIKLGSSTTVVEDGIIKLADVVTFYNPTGENPPAYRYVVDIVRLQNVIYNISLKFAAPEWAAAPLIPDNQPTNNPKARKPKHAKAEAAAILDSLGLAAIISDPETSKKAIVAGIDGTNDKRLNLTIPVMLSGNTNVKDVKVNFSFYFGVQAAA